MKRIVTAAISILCFMAPMAGYGEQLDPSQAVNVAGSQRMLSQRMVKAYCQMGLGEYFGEPDQQIKDGVALFERNMTNLAPYIDEGEAAMAAADVRIYWTNYKSLVTTRPNRADAYKLFDTSERLLAAAQKMVEAIQAATGVKTGAVVNMAGRQRMLSQRMAMLHMMKIWDISDEAVEQKSQEARAQFIEAHGKLLREPRNTPEIKKNLETVANLLKLLDHSLKSKEGLTFTVATTTEKILKNMDEVTRAYAELEQTSVK